MDVPWYKSIKETKHNRNTIFVAGAAYSPLWCVSVSNLNSSNLRSSKRFELSSRLSSFSQRKFLSWQFSSDNFSKCRKNIIMEEVILISMVFFSSDRKFLSKIKNTKTILAYSKSFSKRFFEILKIRLCQLCFGIFELEVSDLKKNPYLYLSSGEWWEGQDSTHLLIKGLVI